MRCSFSRGITNLNTKINKCYFWIDSTIPWIQGCPSKKTFVANRVLEQLTSASRWYNAPGQDNPSDIASRGSSVSLRDT